MNTNPCPLVRQHCQHVFECGRVVGNAGNATDAHVAVGADNTCDAGNAGNADNTSSADIAGDARIAGDAFDVPYGLLPAKILEETSPPL